MTRFRSAALIAFMLLVTKADAQEFGPWPPSTNLDCFHHWMKTMFCYGTCADIMGRTGVFPDQVVLYNTDAVCPPSQNIYGWPPAPNKSEWTGPSCLDFKKELLKYCVNRPTPYDGTPVDFYGVAKPGQPIPWGLKPQYLAEKKRFHVLPCEWLGTSVEVRNCRRLRR